MLTSCLAGLGAAALFAAGAQAPPIQNPGAPGQGSRAITAEESVDMSRSSHTAADVRFLQHMIVHHAQAVEMNALIEGRTDNAVLHLLGERIARSQDSEMTFMRRWLEERGQSVEDAGLHAGHGGHAGHDHRAGHTGRSGHQEGHSDHGDHAGHAPDRPAMDPDDVPLMPGMLSPNQMRALAAAEGRRFDRLWLEGMIHHHQGALDMVEALLAAPGNGEDPQLSEFLTHVTADQAAEILRMETMLSALESPGEEEEEADRP